MNNKGFTNIILIILVAVLTGALVYVTAIKKPAPSEQPQTNNLQNTQPITNPPANTSNINPTPVSRAYSEPEILASLKTSWQITQTLIPFRPSYNNQTENAKKIWRAPRTVQFIGKNNVLVRFEDDSNVHVAVFKFDSGKFDFLTVLKNQAEFSLSDWQNLVNKYGDNAYSVSTYTISLIRNKQIVSFPELTKVSENIFVKNYWEQYDQVPVVNQNTPATITTNTFAYDQKILTNLITNWKTIGVSVLPDFPDPNKAFYGYPRIIQLIGNNAIIISYEDGYNPLFAVLKYDSVQQKFTYLNKYGPPDFRLNATLWNSWRSTYGNSSIAPQTYKFSSQSTGDIVSPSDWTLIEENPFTLN